LQRVLVTVGELGYRPNRAALSLRRRESRLVGLHIQPPQPDRAGSVHDRFLHALAEESARSGYHVLPFAAGEVDEICAFNELLSTTAVDAFVLTDTHRADARARWLLCRDAPFVAFGRPWDEAPAHAWVDVDGAAGIATVVDHLVQRGHRRVGYVGWGEASELGNDRRSGWEKACARHGLDNAGLEVRCSDRIADGVVGASHLLDRDDAPTALVCASDTLAMGALRALDTRAMSAGRDVAVTGFDDTPTAAALPVGLTSVRQPLEDVAAAIVKQLDAVLSDAGTSGTGELLTPTLVVRGTS
jgi:DNA-binding LacI/PurR family transcriptional regulator